MYKETAFIPKIMNKVDDLIIANDGVTQGQQTSMSFFSFEVQEIPKYANLPTSFISGQKSIFIRFGSKKIRYFERISRFPLRRHTHKQTYTGKVSIVSFTAKIYTIVKFRIRNHPFQMQN